MFESVYQVNLKSGVFTKYFSAWKKISSYMMQEKGAVASYFYIQPSLGLEPTKCLIHSRWPNIDMNKKAWPLRKNKWAISDELLAAEEDMEQSVISIDPVRPFSTFDEVDEYSQQNNFALHDSLENIRKNILIYNDNGCGDSTYQIVDMLRQVVNVSLCRILTVDASYLLNIADWERTTRLLIIPGGRARPYYTALGAQWQNDVVAKGEIRRLSDIGLGNQRIKDFVENGGSYLGICAGAYYGAKNTVFERGGKWEVLDDGALNFFSGTAEGPAYGLGRFQYNSEQGAEVAELSSSQLLYANDLDVYFNGGCFFRMEDGEQIPNEQVLAAYQNIKKEDGTSPAAIIENSVGKGLVILSGTHFEYFSNSPASGFESEVITKLSRTDDKRALFQGEVFARLGIPLSQALHNKIYAKQISELPLLAPDLSSSKRNEKFNIVRFDIHESTQVYAETHEEELRDYKIGEWRVVIADQQTKGQGTYGRVWASPPGNVYVTFSTIAPLQGQQLHDVPQIVVISIMQVLKTFGLEPEYKWVNDVLIEDKKISGILCRTGGSIGDNAVLHIGIGINVALSLVDCNALPQPATSINLALGKQVNKETVIELLKRSLSHHFDCYLNSGRYFMTDELNRRLAFVGKNIVFDLEDDKKTIIKGSVIGIDENGWVIIRNSENGSIGSYHTGRILRGKELESYLQNNASRQEYTSGMFRNPSYESDSVLNYSSKR